MCLCHVRREGLVLRGIDEQRHIDHLAARVEAARGARPCKELRPGGEGPRRGHVDKAVHEGDLVRGGVGLRLGLGVRR